MPSYVALAFAALFLVVAGCGTDQGPAPSGASKGSAASALSPPDPAVVAGGLEPATLEELERLTAAVERAPADPASWAALGAAYEASRVPAGAQVAFAAAASLEPTDPKLWYRASITAAKGGDVELALERLGTVLELAPEYGPAWRRRGTWLLDLGLAEEAGVAFRRAAELLPGLPDAQLGLARVALAQDDVQAGVELARAALELAPGDSYARNVLGTALRRAGLTEEAKPHLIAGQNSTPVYVDPWSESAQRSARADEDRVARAEQLLDEKNWDEGIALLRELQRDLPTDTKLPLRTGIALMSAGRFEEAVEHYRQATETFPAVYNLQAASIAALVATKRHAEALKAADKTIARWPDRPAAYLQRGLALEAMGDLDAARAAFQRATELKPSDLRGTLFEGRMIAKAGRLAEAADVLESGLDQPGANAPIVYYQNLIAVRRAAGADRAALMKIVARARRTHGAGADVLIP